MSERSASGGRLKVIDPAKPLITPDALRLHVHADDDSEQPLLSAYLDAAQSHAQHYTDRAIGEQTVELALDCFPSGGQIDLPLGPVKSVTSIKYTDAAGAEQTFPVENCLLDDYGEQHALILMPTFTWPSTASMLNAVRVRYVAGGEVSPAVVAALLLLVGTWYENRESVVTTSRGVAVELPLGVRALLDTQRVWGV